MKDRRPTAEEINAVVRDYGEDAVDTEFWNELYNVRPARRNKLDDGYDPRPADREEKKA